jgi:hypothetical protein
LGDKTGIERGWAAVLRSHPKELERADRLRRPIAELADRVLLRRLAVLPLSLGEVPEPDILEQALRALGERT